MLEKRARYFRNQGVAVVLVGAVSMVAAMAAQSPVPLLGILLLLVPSGMFFVADGKVLDRWRSQLLTPWARGELDMAAFRAAIRANPALPKGTIEGMLATLPDAGDLAAEQRMSTPTRQAIAAATLANYRSNSDAMALKAAASAVGGAALIAAAAMRRWEPLAALVCPLLVPVAVAWMRRGRLAESQREASACRTQPGFSDPDFARLIAGLR